MFPFYLCRAHDYSDLVCTEAVVRDLSRALLQVARGLEPKYLGVPLGNVHITSFMLMQFMLDLNLI